MWWLQRAATALNTTVRHVRPFVRRTLLTYLPPGPPYLPLRRSCHAQRPADVEHDQAATRYSPWPADRGYARDQRHPGDPQPQADMSMLQTVVCS